MARLHVVRLAGLWARAGSSHIRRGLVFSKALVDDLPQQTVIRPGQKFDLGNEFGSHPMNARKDERRAEPARSGRRHIEGHFLDRERLESTPKPFEFGIRNS